MSDSDGETPAGGEQDGSADGRKSRVLQLIETAKEPELADDTLDDEEVGAPGLVPQDWGFSVERINKEWALVLIGSKAVMVRSGLPVSGSVSWQPKVFWPHAKSTKVSPGRMWACSTSAIFLRTPCDV